MNDRSLLQELAGWGLPMGKGGLLVQQRLRLVRWRSPSGSTARLLPRRWELQLAPVLCCLHLDDTTRLLLCSCLTEGFRSVNR